MQPTDIAVRPAGNVATVRQEFGATELTAQHETAAAAVAAREQAAVQARYIMAIQRPRNIEQFRKRIIDFCLKPEFAKKVEYAKPVGKKWNPRTGQEEEQFVTGPSIRFIEAALQCFGNVLPQTATVFDNPLARICRASVTDLENNITYEAEVVISKTVERKGFEKGKKGSGQWEPPKGRVVISERLNSWGEPTYLVVATEDEIQSKQNSLLSKAIRTNGQRLLPWDIVDECLRTARQTVADKDAKDPDAAKREILDYFASIGVEPIDIEALTGYSVAKPLQPKQIAELRSIWKAVSNGEVTWAELMASREQTGSEELQNEVRDRKLEEAKRAIDNATTKPPVETAPPVSETKQAEPETKEQKPETKEQPADEATPKSSRPLFGHGPRSK